MQNSLITFILTAFQKFWRQYPALLYALFILLGFGSSLSWNILLVFPLGLLSLPLLFRDENGRGGHWIRLVLAGMLFLGTFGFAKVYYHFPILSLEGSKGIAYVDIDSISSMTTSFGKKWVYRGVLQSFEPDDPADTLLKARHIPCSISLMQNLEVKRPQANQAYRFHAILKESAPGYYSLTVQTDTPWYPLTDSWTFAEARFQAKQYVNAYIQHHITGKQAATFLAGIATGDFDDRQMTYEFSRFGLQHIMAISGFHFAIIAGILSMLLQLIVNKKRTTFLLIFLLSTYFVFLGCSPSIMRAWIVILIGLLGFLVKRQCSGLNSLGVAMLGILLLNPLLCRNLGFQFSFATTAAILLLYPATDLLFQKIFAKRSLSQVIEMDGINQHGYCVLTFLRQGLALTCAVNLIALPITLFYFQKFPVLSLIYNLFFPFMVSFSMLLLLMGVLLTFILPPIGYILHTINSSYTQFVLNFTYHMPTSLDFTWRVHSVSPGLLIGYLSLIFALGICIRSYLDQQYEDLQNFAFI